MAPLSFYSYTVLAFIVFGGMVCVHGDRRGIEKGSTRSFSAQEQALFGSGNAEDCILGPVWGSSYVSHNPVEEIGSVVKKKSRNDIENTNTSADKLSVHLGGFGRFPALSPITAQ